MLCRSHLWYFMQVVRSFSVNMFLFSFVVTAKHELFVTVHFQELFSSSSQSTLTFAHARVTPTSLFSSLQWSVSACLNKTDKKQHCTKSTQRKTVPDVFKNFHQGFWHILASRCNLWVIPWWNNNLFVWQEGKWSESRSACDSFLHSVIIQSISQILRFCYCLCTRY